MLAAGNSLGANFAGIGAESGPNMMKYPSGRTDRLFSSTTAGKISPHDALHQGKRSPMVQVGYHFSV